MGTKNALFVGMLTWDVLYMADRTPRPNEKMMAQDMLLSAGGPASNAAVTYAALGGHSTLMAACGSSPVGGLVGDDLLHHGVRLVDLRLGQAGPPPVSSIVVTKGTGERAVMSMNASQPVSENEEDWNGLFAQVPGDITVILADGHQPVAAVEAKTRRPDALMVLDCGTWREGFNVLLPLADYAICSGHFLPPSCRSADDVFEFIGGYGVDRIAVSNGERPVEYLDRGVRGSVQVPRCAAVDTMGAGDVLHGAFCHCVHWDDFSRALKRAAEVASFSCRFFGTRAWIGKWADSGRS